MLAMLALKRVGVEAQVALVRAGGGIRDRTPGLSVFNHMVVALEPQTPGEPVQFIDVTAPDYSFGTVPPTIRNRRASSSPTPQEG